MNRDEAIALLTGGKDGVREWNEWRSKGEPVPDLSNAILRDADLSRANLRSARLSNAYFRDANLSKADLNGADLRAAILSGADLDGANLRGADLGDAHLQTAHLRNANLGKVDLTNADLSGANLRGARLCDADLSRANLRGANLSTERQSDTRSDLDGANLRGTDLSGADLSGAKLSRAMLQHTGLAGTKFNNSEVANTIFGDLDLSEAIGLEDVRHYGPSTIGIETILKSGGKIPASFLEGCGVPDNWITYLPSLLGKAIDFYSCFISYSHQDEEFSKRLHSRMREDKLRVWFAPEDIKSGRKIHEQIDSAIKLHDKLLVVLTEHSMQSEWVKTEIWHARQREVEEGRRVLFPTRLVPFEAVEDWKAFDEATGKDMAREIRSYFIPDFSDWKDHDSFEESYRRLMKDFKPSPDDP